MDTTLTRYLDGRYGIPVDNSELEERIDDFLNDRKNFSDVVECDIELMYGLIHSIYNAIDMNRMDSACMFARSMHQAIKDRAEQLVRAK